MALLFESKSEIGILYTLFESESILIAKVESVFISPGGELDDAEHSHRAKSRLDGLTAAEAGTEPGADAAAAVPGFHK